MSFYEILEEIKRNTKKYPFNLVAVLNSDILIGQDSEDRACVFVKALDDADAPSIKTAKLQVEFNKPYQLLVNQQTTIKEKFHSIRCLSNQPEDSKIFITVIESILSEKSNKITAYALTSIFYSLLSLFKTGISSDTKQERQGLWAELCFMKNFGGFVDWAETWHSDPDKPFDFSYEEKRVEVKSTLRSERIHEFSHRQLFSLFSEDIVVVSILLKEDDAGMSLRELINEATSVLKGTPNFIKLERAIIRADMLNIDDNGPTFNESEAVQNLAWLRAEQVPRFGSREPEGVSGTRYRSDLTNAPKISNGEIKSWLTQFGIHF